MLLPNHSVTAILFKMFFLLTVLVLDLKQLKRLSPTVFCFIFIHLDDFACNSSTTRSKRPKGQQQQPEKKKLKIDNQNPAIVRKQKQPGENERYVIINLNLT